MKIVAAAVVLLMAAFPCAAASWKSIRKDANAQLSVDTQSINRKGDDASIHYMVDFRSGQAVAGVRNPFRSIVVNAKVSCANRTIALLGTDGYAQYGARGTIVARTAPNPAEAGPQPLEPGTSDEDVWRYVCEDKKAPDKEKKAPEKK